MDDQLFDTPTPKVKCPNCGAVAKASEGMQNCKECLPQIHHMEPWPIEGQLSLGGE